MARLRFDIVSDTHGRLSKRLLEQLEGADVIVHAGDICSLADYRRLCEIARVYACKGNNDFGLDYGPEVQSTTRFFRGGLRWQVCHYRDRLDTRLADVSVCGHTHKPYVERTSLGHLVMNPGSPTWPRTNDGPTMGRIIVEDGQVLSAEIVHLGS